MSTRTWIVAAVAVTTLGVSAQPGLAATVRSSHGHIVFTDTAQRVNDVTVIRESGRIRFRDAAVAPTAGPGCAPAGQNRVSCPAHGVRSITLLLGPAADSVILRPRLLVHAIEIQGGPGADAVKTGGPAISAFGGGGNDRLHGGPMADLLQGGDGNDNLRSADGPDILAGNGGDDLAVGGGGRDLVSGGDDDDNLYGRAGNDILRGARGEDIVIDLHGVDRLYGGADADYLNTKDGETGDFQNAGAGPDYGCAASPFPGDVLIGCDERAGPCCILPRDLTDLLRLSQMAAVSRSYEE